MSSTLDAPFTVQAPGGIWVDPMYENACEEASALMAIHWARGTSFTDPKREIYDLAKWEETAFGQWYDLSAEDTAKMIRDYFKYDKVEYKSDVSVDDVKKALAEGKLVIAPMDGQKLANPHYTQPGPVEHMLAVIGYDAAKKQFITNDPGTKFGAKYRYDEDSFFDALRDYPTGKYQPISEIHRNIIIVSK